MISPAPSDEMLSRRRWSRSWMKSIISVAIAPIAYIPAPIAIPTPTVAHSPAAVVMPRAAESPRRMMMTPAPRKPMAETTPAAMRDGSSETLSYGRTSKNPYFETSIISADASATMICVLMPAFLERFSLSSPIRAPQMEAATSLTAYSRRGSMAFSYYAFPFACSQIHLAEAAPINDTIWTATMLAPAGSENA